ncbi:uncharacterized protein STEHIDRAFT_165786 [Stereum hirsutum FP-91666 SS1]|uniref:uncharacterized protein n=1 Tax=Stereum hirsutum (strain FP-91666) TaxID=721885 RepID=UPI000440F1E9|nr:uncharacterized protein STEHIDRAFT_165786 [Stereum hirsutum FP-91666 SS1]EIM91494.1 hypothetical protein STEHIDRAFT_165786 [Stereum hirsutum FP-91666 SS1]
MLFSLATATLLATIARASVPIPALLNRQDSGLLPLGQNCTANAECQSEKCWPVSWYYGQTVCSPSPAGVACTDGSTCISGVCTSDGVCDKNTGTSFSENGKDGPLCYTSSDCYGDNCIAPFLGGGQNTQCFPTHVGNYCDDLTGCVSGNCVNATCQPGNHAGAACFFSDANACDAPFKCDVVAMSSPTGDCIQSL